VEEKNEEQVCCFLVVVDSGGDTCKDNVFHTSAVRCCGLFDANRWVIWQLEQKTALILFMFMITFSCCELFVVNHCNLV
jgi:hypothetical protein